MTRLELLAHIKAGRNTSVKIAATKGGHSVTRNIISGQLRLACKAQVIHSLPGTCPVEYVVGPPPRAPKKEYKHADLASFKYDRSRPVTDCARR